LRTEDAPACLAAGFGAFQTFAQQACLIGTHPGGQRVHIIRLVQRGDRLHGGVEQADQVGERIAEEAGHPQRHVHPWAVEQADRQDLEILHAQAAGLPHRAHAEQREGLGDIVAAGAHGRRAPHRQAELAQVVAVVLQVAFEHAAGGLEA